MSSSSGSSSGRSKSSKKSKSKATSKSTAVAVSPVSTDDSINASPAAAASAPPNESSSLFSGAATTAAEAVNAVILAIGGGSSSSAESTSAGIAVAAAGAGSGSDSVSIAVGAEPLSGNSSASGSAGKPKTPASAKSVSQSSAASSSSSGGDSPEPVDERHPLVGVAVDRERRDGEWLDDAVRPDQYEYQYYWSLASVLQWVLSRLFTVFLLLMGDHHHWLNRTATSFFGLELVLTLYYWHNKRYFPGSVYTDLHFLMYGRTLRATYLHDRFTPGFRFVFGLWGYFVVSGVLLNVDQWGDSDSFFFRIASYVILVISIKQIVLYTPVIAIWYVSLVVSAYYYLCCWFVCISAEHVPMFQDVTKDQWSFPLYKFIFERV